MTRKEILGIVLSLLLFFALGWVAMEGDEMCAVQMTDPGLKQNLSAEEQKRCAAVMERTRNGPVR